MKKITLFITLLFAVAVLNAQSEKYVKAMENLVPGIDTTHTQEGLTELANSFERIANAEVS